MKSLNDIAKEVIISNYLIYHSNSMNKKTLAERMNVSNSTVTNLLNDGLNISISFDLLEKYCNATNERTDKLIEEIAKKVKANS